MVLGRLIQGIGGGPMTPVSQAILLAAFPADKKRDCYESLSMLVQSRLMAYVDVFETFALIAFCLIPLAFLFNISVKTQKYNLVEKVSKHRHDETIKY